MKKSFGLRFFVEPLIIQAEIRSELCRVLDIDERSALKEIMVGKLSVPHHVWEVNKPQLEFLLRNGELAIGRDYSVFLKSARVDSFRLASRQFLSLLSERTLDLVLSRIRIQNQHPTQSRYCYFVASRTVWRKQIISLLKKVHEPFSDTDMTTLTLRDGSSVEAWQVRPETLTTMCADVQLGKVFLSIVYRWNMSLGNAYPERVPSSLLSKIRKINSDRAQDEKRSAFVSVHN